MPRSTFFRLLSLPGVVLRRTNRQMDAARAALLALLDGHTSPTIQRIEQRVRFAQDLEALWYLRQDIVVALAEFDGETAARARITAINGLFKGKLPTALGPRTHQSFTH
jgi:hypothetical protein